MGIVHQATLSPSKRELVESWLPSRSWADGLRIAEKVAEYRLDDPAGEVGVETILWRTEDGMILQTPLTYRATPLPGAEEHLIGTSDHSVLGERWVYDGCGDPVWAGTLVEAILTEGTQSPMFFEDDGVRVDIPARVLVRGTGGYGTVPDIGAVDTVTDDGNVTIVRADGIEIAVARVVGTPLDDGPRLLGTLAGSDESMVLAALVARTGVE